MASAAFTDPDAEAAKLEHGEDGTIILAQGMSAEGAVVAIQEASLDQQSFQEISMLTNDIVEELGSSGEARGVADADTATQASLIDNRLEVRE